MSLVLNGTTGITNPGAYTGDGVSFADGTPSNTLVTTTGGNVGIGTSSPVDKLHVSGAVVSTSNTVLTTTESAIFDYNPGQSAGRMLAYRSTGSNLIFYTNPNAGSLTERMRITSAGNVGIGTSSPNSSLTVSKTTTLLSGTGNQFGVNIYPTTTGECFVDAVTGGSGNADISFRSYNNGTYHRMRFNSSGQLLVGTTAPFIGVDNERVSIVQPGVGPWAQGIQIGNEGNATLYTNFSGTAAYSAISFRNNGTTFSLCGGITVSGSSTAYNTSSDYRLKHDIQPMTGALAKVAQLKPVTYKWKLDGSDGQGFIAHELQEVVPECVTGEKDAVDAEGKPVYQGIDTSFLAATMVAAIQELKAELDTVKAELATLKGATE